MNPTAKTTRSGGPDGASSRDNSLVVNEVYPSIQGESTHAGEPCVFVRLTGCNLRCAMEPSSRSPGGFDCDTEFQSGVWRTQRELCDLIDEIAGECAWIVLTGGEPMLQVDDGLIRELHSRAYQIQIETNGTRQVPDTIDYITVSPKVAEHCIKQRFAHEVKYVRDFTQGIPRTVVKADKYYISPAFDGFEPSERSIKHCEELCRQNPPWELSVQMHKVWNVR